MKHLLHTTLTAFGSAILFIATSCNSNSPKVPQSTIKDTLQRVAARPPRFIIIQSTIAAKATFKLDSYTGDVYQLVANKDNNEAWQILKRMQGSSEDTRYPNSRNYNLFVSTLAIRFTYLINVNTGATWEFVIDPKTQEDFFAPIDTY